MEQDQGEVVTDVPDLSRVSLVDVPVLAAVIARLTRDGDQISEFNSSIQPLRTLDGPSTTRR